LKRRTKKTSNVINLKDRRGETRVDVFQRLHEEMVNNPDFQKEMRQKDLDLLKKIENENPPPNLRVIKRCKK